MGDATRRRWRNFEGRTTVPVQGWGAVFVGLLFTVAGAVFIIFGLAALAAGVRGVRCLPSGSYYD